MNLAQKVKLNVRLNVPNRISWSLKQTGGKSVNVCVFLNKVSKMLNVKRLTYLPIQGFEVCSFFVAGQKS